MAVSSVGTMVIMVLCKEAVLDPDIAGVGDDGADRANQRPGWEGQGVRSSHGGRTIFPNIHGRAGIAHFRVEGPWEVDTAG